MVLRGAASEWNDSPQAGSDPRGDGTTHRKFTRDCFAPAWRSETATRTRTQRFDNADPKQGSIGETRPVVAVEGRRTCRLASLRDCPGSANQPFWGTPFGFQRKKKPFLQSLGNEL